MSKQDCHFNLEEADENFSETVVDKNLTLFVTDYYQYFKQELETARKNKDITKIKISVHTLKSTSRYLCCEYFAEKSQKIEDVNGKALSEIEKVYDEYLKCFDYLYEDAKDQFEKRFKKPEEKEDVKVVKPSDKIMNVLNLPKITISDELTLCEPGENSNACHTKKLSDQKLNNQETIEEKDEKDERSDNEVKELLSNPIKRTKSRFTKSLRM
jgi:hypothetical protein